MTQFIGNPSNYSDRTGRVVPFCPLRAEVAQSLPPQISGMDVYMLHRYEWSRYERKGELARRLYQSGSYQSGSYQSGSYQHVPTTLHDYTTGRLAPPIPGPKFGDLLSNEQYRQRRGEWELRVSKQKSKARLLREVLNSSPDDTAEWAQSFQSLYGSVRGSDNKARILKHIEGKLECTSTECDKCSDPVFYTQEVRTGRRGSADWCVGCVGERAGTYGDDYYDSDILVHIQDEDTYVPDWVADSDYYEHSNGDWYSEPEQCDDDDDDDDYDGGDSGSGSCSELHRYHSTKRMLRGWTMAPDGAPTISTGCWAPMTIGIELEVEATDSRSDTVAPLVYSLRDIIGDESLFAEEDGSLDDDSGFELIFGWSDLPSWQRAMPRIGTALTEGSVISHDAGTNYGLHVNVAVSSNVSVQAAITWFINDNANAKLLFALARREPTCYCPREHGRYWPTDSHNAAVNFGNTAGVFRANTNGTNVDCDSTIASFRLFRGTINPVRLMADIEFCHSLVSAATAYSYTILEDASMCTDLFKRFTMRYWQTHVLKNITRYPTLVNYLRHWDKTNPLSMRKHVQDDRRHGAFTDFAMTRFISQYPMGTLTGATHDGLDKRALALLNHTIASIEE